MINSVLEITCTDCLGKGLVFFGDDNDYSVEPCDCVAVEIGK
jgi:hypothetical protein